jgi:uncharacterized protein
VPIDWAKTHAAVWRAHKAYLRPITHIDPIGFDQPIGIEEQRTALVRNTEHFPDGGGANNALLWGSRGTGKSSLIKALLNQYNARGLRLIQVDRNDLVRDPLTALPLHRFLRRSDLRDRLGLVLD